MRIYARTGCRSPIPRRPSPGGTQNRRKSARRSHQ
jgi:hypothetical protein